MSVCVSSTSSESLWFQVQWIAQQYFGLGHCDVCDNAVNGHVVRWFLCTRDNVVWCEDSFPMWYLCGLAIASSVI